MKDYNIKFWPSKRQLVCEPTEDGEGPSSWVRPRQGPPPWRPPPRGFLDSRSGTQRGGRACGQGPARRGAPQPRKTQTELPEDLRQKPAGVFSSTAARTIFVGTDNVTR